MPGPIITLLSDFGLSDAYVGAMKGVILSINPEAILVDLSHDVSPQDVLQGAFILGTAWRYFPPGTVHAAVVDPGVGTGRKAILLRAHDQFFIAPDNGILSLVLPPDDRKALVFQPYTWLVPEGFRAYSLTNAAYWLRPTSATFHGRDIFAPVAAHVSLGVPAARLGESVKFLARLGVPIPAWRRKRLVGHVVSIDRFGNVVTSVPGALLPPSREEVTVEFKGRQVQGLVPTYGAGAGLVALVGSHGYLELAMVNGNAAAELEAAVGDEVVVRKG